MPCRRDGQRADEKFEYTVILSGRVQWSLAQDQMLWLMTGDPNFDGFFKNGFVPGEDQTVYRFTDSYTAMIFKLKYG